MRRLAVSVAAAGLISAVLLLLPRGGAKAAFIYESAIAGPPRSSGGAIDEGVYQGVRFTIAEVAQVRSIGGHLGGNGRGTLFGAVMSLSSPTALPSGDPFDSSLLASVVFQDPGFSVPGQFGGRTQEFFAPLEVTLQPGTYALVFGTGALGAVPATSGVTFIVMPTTDINIGDPEYIAFAFGGSSTGWQETTGKCALCQQQTVSVLLAKCELACKCACIKVGKPIGEHRVKAAFPQVLIGQIPAMLARRKLHGRHRCA